MGWIPRKIFGTSSSTQIRAWFEPSTFVHLATAASRGACIVTRAKLSEQVSVAPRQGRESVICAHATKCVWPVACH